MNISSAYSASSPQLKSIFFLGTHEDTPYLPRLKPLLAGHSVLISTAAISTLAEVQLFCKSKSINYVISTSETLLSKLFQGRKVSIDSFAGSFIFREDIGYLFVDPLKQLISVPYGEFILKRYLSKIINPSAWEVPRKFSWKLLTETNYVDWLGDFSCSHCLAVAVDIETRKDLSISCIGYTGIFYSFGGEEWELRSVVLPLDSMFAVEIMRKFNWECKKPKILQNGKYDIAYLFRYNSPLYNYLWDTATMFHCWYSELPKDLATLGAFFIREIQNWKDLAQTSDLMQYYEYNARDTWATAQVFLGWMKEAPEFALENYKLEFPLNFAAHLCEMTGVKRDPKRLKLAKLELDSQIQSLGKSLNKMLLRGKGEKGEFNVSSPKQMKLLLKVLGFPELTSADEKNLKKVGYSHPLNDRIVEHILTIREKRKLVSTYLTSGEAAKEFPQKGELNGRLLYSLNPHGTDTGRLASRSHHFWCGMPIHTIPRGKEVKQTIVADEGFMFAEVDLEQAETRDTAYISGDKALIAAVNSPHDFHSLNACAFFGRVYEDIYDDEKKRTKDKKLRDLTKRVNHGANYNMGARVMVETLGLKILYEAASLLKLPKHLTTTQIAEYLLSRFHATYSSMKPVYYAGVTRDVLTHRKLVGATGWTRYCFGNPLTNKQALNAYIAHCPQSLNAMVLNKAFMSVFYDLALDKKYGDNFKLCAQIHDSILFQFRIGHEYLIEEVRKRMEIPIKIKGYDDMWREFTVPAAAKAGEDGKGSKYWSELE